MPHLLPIRVGSLSFRDERSMSREQAREGRRVFRK
ncbi:hypothetical protein LCGC14_0793440, partial [marine sediment metagenome]